MKHLKTYDELNEKSVFDKYRRIQNNILNKLNLNLYFIKKNGTTVTSIYPFFESLIKQNISYSISSTDCVLLTICALSNIFNESKSNIDKIMMIIQEKGFKSVLSTFITAINDLYTLFVRVADLFGKPGIIISEMFTYSTLFIPFIFSVNLFIKKYKINQVNFNNIVNNNAEININTPKGQISLNLDFTINYIQDNIKSKIN